MDTPDEIEVGADGGDLRYWRAKEALRQGEIRLGAQVTVRAALEARATALTGWASAAFLAVVGAAFATQDLADRLGAIAAGILLMAAALLGVHAARPRDWSMVGYDPVTLRDSTLETELEELEAMALGISPGIDINNRRINATGRMLRWAGWCLLAAPAAGGATYLCALASAG